MAEQKEVESNADALKVQYIELHELMDVLSTASEILPWEDECGDRIDRLMMEESGGSLS